MARQSGPIYRGSPATIVRSPSPSAPSPSPSSGGGSSPSTPSPSQPSTSSPSPSGSVFISQDKSKPYFGKPVQLVGGVITPVSSSPKVSTPIVSSPSTGVGSVNYGGSVIPVKPSYVGLSSAEYSKQVADYNRQVAQKVQAVTQGKPVRSTVINPYLGTTSVNGTVVGVQGKTALSTTEFESGMYAKQRAEGLPRSNVYKYTDEAGKVKYMRTVELMARNDPEGYLRNFGPSSQYSRLAEDVKSGKVGKISDYTFAYSKKGKEFARQQSDLVRSKFVGEARVRGFSNADVVNAFTSYQKPISFSNFLGVQKNISEVGTFGTPFGVKKDYVPIIKSHDVVSENVVSTGGFFSQSNIMLGGGIERGGPVLEATMVPSKVDFLGLLEAEKNIGNVGKLSLQKPSVVETDVFGQVKVPVKEKVSDGFYFSDYAKGFVDKTKSSFVPIVSFVKKYESSLYKDFEDVSSKKNMKEILKSDVAKKWVSAATFTLPGSIKNKMEGASFILETVGSPSRIVGEDVVRSVINVKPQNVDFSIFKDVKGKEYGINNYLNNLYGNNKGILSGEEVSSRFEAEKNIRIEKLNFGFEKENVKISKNVFDIAGIKKEESSKFTQEGKNLIYTKKETIKTSGGGYYADYQDEAKKVMDSQPKTFENLDEARKSYGKIVDLNMRYDKGEITDAYRNLKMDFYIRTGKAGTFGNELNSVNEKYDAKFSDLDKNTINKLNENSLSFQKKIESISNLQPGSVTEFVTGYNVGFGGIKKSNVGSVDYNDVLSGAGLTKGDVVKSVFGDTLVSVGGLVAEAYTFGGITKAVVPGSRVAFKKFNKAIESNVVGKVVSYPATAVGLGSAESLYYTGLKTIQTKGEFPKQIIGGVVSDPLLALGTFGVFEIVGASVKGVKTAEVKKLAADLEAKNKVLASRPKFEYDVKESANVDVMGNLVSSKNVAEGNVKVSYKRFELDKNNKVVKKTVVDNYLVSTKVGSRLSFDKGSVDVSTKLKRLKKGLDSGIVNTVDVKGKGSVDSGVVNVNFVGGTGKDRNVRVGNVVLNYGVKPVEVSEILTIKNVERKASSFENEFMFLNRNRAEVSDITYFLGDFSKLKKPKSSVVLELKSGFGAKAGIVDVTTKSKVMKGNVGDILESSNFVSYDLGRKTKKVKVAYGGNEVFVDRFIGGGLKKGIGDNSFVSYKMSFNDPLFLGKSSFVYKTFFGKSKTMFEPKQKSNKGDVAKVDKIKAGLNQDFYVGSDFAKTNYGSSDVSYDSKIYEVKTINNVKYNVRDANGVIDYVAEYKYLPDKYKRFILSNSLKYTKSFPNVEKVNYFFRKNVDFSKNNCATAVSLIEHRLIQDGANPKDVKSVGVLIPQTQSGRNFFSGNHKIIIYDGKIYDPTINQFASLRGHDQVYGIDKFPYDNNSRVVVERIINEQIAKKHSRADVIGTFGGGKLSTDFSVINKGVKKKGGNDVIDIGDTNLLFGELKGGFEKPGIKLGGAGSIFSGTFAENFIKGESFKPKVGEISKSGVRVGVLNKQNENVDNRVRSDLGLDVFSGFKFKTDVISMPDFVVKSKTNVDVGQKQRVDTRVAQMFDFGYGSKNRNVEVPAPFGFGFYPFVSRPNIPEPAPKPFGFGFPNLESGGGSGSRAADVLGEKRKVFGTLDLTREFRKNKNIIKDFF